MHTATQILAQRAAPALPMRNKPRWQPYYSTIQPALPPRSPTASYLHTPSTHVSPPNQASCSTTTAREQARPTPITSTPLTQTPKESSQRDANPKHKFAAGLIDQAVNILSEIWRPHDVPDVFKASAKTANPLGGAGSMSKSFDSQLPPLSSTMSSKIHHANTFPETDDTNLIPMKTFVHEVLKRSRTSASILQAALCYLEAIRPQVPEILDEERRGIRALYRPDSTILPATEDELRMDAELTRLENEADLQQILPISAIVSAQDSTDAVVNTVRITDSDDMDSTVSGTSAIFSASASEDTSMTSISSGKVTSSALPSPLLCPRRAFLASLILASKFFQDKCYSNRAWAKLSGLPAREIGRCERALGEALHWRLWVGKSAVSPPPAGRPVVRSQTESVLITASSADGGRSSAKADRRPLRKASTMPYASGIEVESTRQRESYDFTGQQVGLQNTPQPSSYVLDSGSSTFTESAQQCNASERAQLEKSTTATPSPDTPGLTYSPSSTDSSGDQTIQIQYEGNMFPSLNSFSTSTSSISTTSAGSSRTWFDGPIEPQGQAPARWMPTSKQQHLFSSATGMYDISIGQAVPAISVVVPDSLMLPDGYRGDEVQLLQQAHQQIMDEAGMMLMAKNANAFLWRADSACPAYETEPVC